MSKSPRTPKTAAQVAAEKDDAEKAKRKTAAQVAAEQDEAEKAKRKTTAKQQERPRR